MWGRGSAAEGFDPIVEALDLFGLEEVADLFDELVNAGHFVLLAFGAVGHAVATVLVEGLFEFFALLEGQALGLGGLEDVDGADGDVAGAGGHLTDLGQFGFLLIGEDLLEAGEEVIFGLDAGGHVFELLLEFAGEFGIAVLFGGAEFGVLVLDFLEQGAGVFALFSDFGLVDSDEGFGLLHLVVIEFQEFADVAEFLFAFGAFVLLGTLGAAGAHAAHLGVGTGGAEDGECENGQKAFHGMAPQCEAVLLTHSWRQPLPPGL